MDIISDKLKTLPDSPGVYLMKNASGKIIYVGKAKVLKNRVRQYFHSSKDHSPKVKAMVSNIADFEYIITGSEREAFVLECNLIKEYRPRYNILLKDDKTYPFIKVTNEAYPRIILTRTALKDGAHYFGPYTSAFYCREMIDLVTKIFKIPTCHKRFPKDLKKDRPCLYYAMGQCIGLCQGTVSIEEYRKAIDEACDFLKGKHKELIKRLTEEMKSAAQNLEFERAAGIRNKIASINYFTEKQNITILKGADADIFAVAAKDNDIAIEALYIRDGKMTGHEGFSFEGALGIDDESLMSDFLSQYYSSGLYIPKLVVISCDTPDKGMLIDYLSEKRGTNVEVRHSIKGKYKELLDMALKNANKTLSDTIEQKLKYQLKRSAVSELGEALGLENPPLRIEAYDISHTSGDLGVGAMVVFEDGKPGKKDYRYFKIKTVEGNNDYESLKEVLIRRFKHCLNEYQKIKEGQMDEEEAKFAILPDLILMDGGKGQVGIAKEVLKEMGLSIPVFGMVKDEKHRTRGLVTEASLVSLSPVTSAFRLVAFIQDEVHRFAISYHRKLREKKLLKSPLLEIKGVGEKRYQKLIKEYKNINAIKNASVEELAKTVGSDTAKAIYEYFKKENG
ncbi:MAG: excinuclease ABC subunit UvrC [Bacillota bacterium]|nr:excinuclease ABC subunit UvrC [Bacillota bacterium]